MSGTVFTEACLKIDKATEDSILAVDTAYVEGIITRKAMAERVSELIFSYLMKEELVLVKNF